MRPAGYLSAPDRPRRVLAVLLTVAAVLLGGPLQTGAASTGTPDRAASAHHTEADRPALTGVLLQQSRAATAFGGEHLTPQHGPPALLPSRHPDRGTDRGPAAVPAPYGSAATAHRRTTRGRAPPDQGALQRSPTAHRHGPH